MLSEAAEFLLGALSPLRNGICVQCAATKVLGKSRDESLKATKELIATGHALAGPGICDLCELHRPLTRLRNTWGTERPGGLA